MELKTTISACFPDSGPPRGRITRILDISPARPDLFNAAQRVFRSGTPILSYALGASRAARVIFGPFHYISNFSRATEPHAFLFLGIFGVIFGRFSLPRGSETVFFLAGALPPHPRQGAAAPWTPAAP